jgi:TfoX/Sxy family transcriptional regulator of competence genes
MAWEKASLEMGDVLSRLLVGFDCQKKQMFGSLVYFINDNMYTGVKGSVVFLRLSDQDRQAIVAECDEVQPFEPKPDFIMREYVEIPESKLFDAEFITRWLKRSYAYVSALPPKEKKARRRR